MTKVVIANAVVRGRKRGSHRSPAAALHRALGSDGHDVDGAVGHRSVSGVASKAKPGKLPVGRDAPLDDRVEHLHPVVGAVGTLKTMLDAGSIRAHIVVEGGRLWVPGGPDGAIHGMGDTKTNYYEAFETKLKKKVGKETWDSRVHLEHIYYQDLLQEQQEKYWRAIDAKHHLRWDLLHKFMLFSFSDAASIEHSLRKDGGLYKKVHQIIAAAFDNAYAALETRTETPILPKSSFS